MDKFVRPGIDDRPDYDKTLTPEQRKRSLFGGIDARTSSRGCQPDRRAGASHQPRRGIDAAGSVSAPSPPWTPPYRIHPPPSWTCAIRWSRRRSPPDQNGRSSASASASPSRRGLCHPVGRPELHHPAARVRIHRPGQQGVHARSGQHLRIRWWRCSPTSSSAPSPI